MTFLVLAKKIKILCSCSVEAQIFHFKVPNFSMQTNFVAGSLHVCNNPAFRDQTFFIQDCFNLWLAISWADSALLNPNFPRISILSCTLWKSILESHGCDVIAWWHTQSFSTSQQPTQHEFWVCSWPAQTMIQYPMLAELPPRFWYELVTKYRQMWNEPLLKRRTWMVFNWVSKVICVYFCCYLLCKQT